MSCFFYLTGEIYHYFSSTKLIDCKVTAASIHGNWELGNQ